MAEGDFPAVNPDVEAYWSMQQNPQGLLATSSAGLLNQLRNLPSYSETGTMRPGAPQATQAAYHEAITNNFRAQPYMPWWAQQAPQANWLRPGGSGYDPAAYYPGFQNVPRAEGNQPRGTNLGFGGMFGYPPGPNGPGIGGGGQQQLPTVDTNSWTSMLTSAPRPGTPFTPIYHPPGERIPGAGDGRLPADADSGNTGNVGLGNIGYNQDLLGGGGGTGGTGTGGGGTGYVPPGWTTGTYNGITGALPTPSTNNTPLVDQYGNRAGPPPPSLDTSSATNFMNSFRFANAPAGSDAAKFNAVMDKYGAQDAMNLLVSGGLWNSLGAQYQNAANDAGMSRDDVNRIINTFGSGGGSYLGPEYGFQAGDYSWGHGFGRNVPGLVF